MGVEWIAPAHVQAGEKLDVRVIVTGEEGTKADKITLRFVGQCSFYIDSRGTVDKVLFDRTITLVESQTTLGERMEYAASFDVPPNACASEGDADSTRFSIEWRLELHMDIPWRIDVKEDRVVYVDPPNEAARPDPQNWRALIAFDSGLRAELLLDDHHLGPGDEVHGKLALFNTTGRSIYDLDVSLALIARYKWKSDERAYLIRRKNVAFATKSGFFEGAVFPFKLTVPNDALPNASSENGELEVVWAVRVHLEHDTHTDVTVVDLDVRAFPSREAPPPSATILIGPTRWRSLFQEVAAEQGFTLSEDDDIAATASFDGTDVRVTLSGPLIMRAEIAKILAERSDLEHGSAFDRLMMEGGRTVVEKDAHPGHSTKQLRTFIDAVKLVAGS